jgi:hypothetical protein
MSVVFHRACKEIHGTCQLGSADRLGQHRDQLNWKKDNGKLRLSFYLNKIAFYRASFLVSEFGFVRYATSWKVASSWPDERDELFSICLILSAARGPGIYSASNRNEYQKQKNNVSGEQSAADAQGWQPCHHLWVDCLYTVGSLTSHNPIGLQGLLRG